MLSFLFLLLSFPLRCLHGQLLLLLLRPPPGLRVVRAFRHHPPCHGRHLASLLHVEPGTAVAGEARVLEVALGADLAVVVREEAVAPDATAAELTWMND